MSESTTAADDTTTIRIKREVPLPYLISALCAIAVQAVVVYQSIQDSAKAVAVQSEAIKDLAGQVRVLSQQINGKDLTDARHDFQLVDHEKRLSAIEAHLKGRP